MMHNLVLITLNWLFKNLEPLQRQLPHTCGLVGRGTPTDERASGACQWHDPPRTKAEDLQQAEQI